MAYTRALFGLIAALVFATSCSNAPDPGDPEAFCDLLRAGVGLVPGDAEGLADLEETAPPEIAATVAKLANTARSLDEIPDENLEELFSAAFDPDAVAARDELRTYAVEECGSDGLETETEGEVVDDSVELEAELEQYVEDNFGTTEWAPAIRLSTDFEFGQLNSVTGSFQRPLEDETEHLAACNALAVFLYEINNGSGEVSITSGGAVLAGRSGPDTQCVIP